jgi:hypothetical protein
MSNDLFRLFVKYQLSSELLCYDNEIDVNKDVDKDVNKDIETGMK